MRVPVLAGGGRTQLRCAYLSLQGGEVHSRGARTCLHSGCVGIRRTRTNSTLWSFVWNLGVLEVRVRITHFTSLSAESDRVGGYTVLQNSTFCFLKCRTWAWSEVRVRIPHKCPSCRIRWCWGWGSVHSRGARTRPCRGGCTQLRYAYEFYT